MLAAIKSFSLDRSDLTSTIKTLAVPTLLTTGANDPMWTVAQAEAAAWQLANGTLVILPAEGHIGPLLEAPEALAELVADFWHEPAQTATRGRG